VDVVVLGLFPAKAVIQVNAGAPRTLAVGQRTPEGVTLVSVEKDSATLDIEGRRRTLRLGQQQGSGAGSSAQSVTLSADSRGHFNAQGQINGQAVTFVVDTGASVVALSSADAERLGLDFRAGRPVSMETANGTARAYRVTLDSVRVGDVALSGVEAVVMENSTMPALLGMSFLNRMNMKREGSLLTLTKRF
jgi:aspartyl protease family protein